jgi:hypothetical protein
MANDSSSLSSPLGDSLRDFKAQNLFTNPGDEIYSFSDLEIAQLKSIGAFPPDTEIHPFDKNVHFDFYSKTWVCFLAFPFTLGLRYPFTPLISEFFQVTGLSYAQAMPVIWRILFVLSNLDETHRIDIRASDLATVFNLRTHGSSRFVLQLIQKDVSPVLKATKNENSWKKKFFFVNRNTIPGGSDLPLKWVTRGRI